MNRLEAATRYVRGFQSNRVTYLDAQAAGPAPPKVRRKTALEAQGWRDKTDLDPIVAAGLANLGYTPEAAQARIDAAPVKFGDERDSELEINRMLWGSAPADDTTETEENSQ